MKFNQPKSTLIHKEKGIYLFAPALLILYIILSVIMIINDFPFDYKDIWLNFISLILPTFIGINAFPIVSIKASNDSLTVFNGLILPGKIRIQKEEIKSIIILDKMIIEYLGPIVYLGIIIKRQNCLWLPGQPNYRGIMIKYGNRKCVVIACKDPNKTVDTLKSLFDIHNGEIRG